MNRDVSPKGRTAEGVSGFEGLVFRPRADQPIWQQIYDHIRSLIDMGYVQPGSQLPGEVHLADTLGVTRITLRRALQQLQQEGHLTARKGVGVFVRSAPSAFVVRDGSRFSDSLKADGKALTTRTLVLETEPAGAEAAQALGLERGAPVIRLARVRAADAQPIYITIKIFPAHILPDFAAVYAARQSVSDAFVSHGIHKYRRTETAISGGFATTEEATLLHLTPGTPVLRTGSTNEDRTGQRIEWTSGCWLLTSVRFIF